VRCPHRLLPIAAALRSGRDQWETPLRLKQARADLYHATYFARAMRPGPPTVVTVHDLIPERYPDYWPRGQRQVIRYWLRASARAARHVVTPSKASAADVEAIYGLPRSRVSVCYNALDPLSGAECTERPPEIGARAFILCVCTNKPHKNLPSLVRAFGKLTDSMPAAPDLIIAGGWDARYVEAQEAANAFGAVQSANGPTIRFIHQPSDAVLLWLYGHAQAFVFPSLYEGFGIPVMEAMRSGVPTAASNTAAVAEIAGDAAMLFDPLNEDACTAAMHRLLEEPDLRARLSEAGKRRAAQFSLEDSAERMLQIYAEALCSA
jgi:glycosyltransferase involved in cell wall biosynthesis